MTGEYLIRLFYKITGFKISDPLTREHYAHNRQREELLGGGYILSQYAKSVSDFKFGKVSASYAGCAAVAIYNALRFLNRPVDFCEVIYRLEQSRLLSLGGKMGTNPCRLKTILEKMMPSQKGGSWRCFRDPAQLDRWKEEISRGREKEEGINGNIKTEKLKAEDVKADIKAEKLKAEDIKADIKAEDIKADIKAEDIKADIKAEDIKADIKAEDIKADIKAEDIKADIKAENIKAAAILAIWNDRRHPGKGMHFYMLCNEGKGWMAMNRQDGSKEESVYSTAAESIGKGRMILGYCFFA